MLRSYPARLFVITVIFFVYAGLTSAADKVLTYDNGKKVAHRSNPGAGHVVSFEPPKGTWYLKEVQIYGTRYGSGYDPEETHFTLFVQDEDRNVIVDQEMVYTAFDYGPASFAWKTLPIEEPFKVPKEFSVGVVFNPTASKGVFVGYSEADEAHSFWGMPGGRLSPFDADKAWMIRAVLSKKRPKFKKKDKEEESGFSTRKRDRQNRKKAEYFEDFEFIEKTVKSSYPCLKKKNIDWKETCKEFEPLFRKCEDDGTHLLNVRRLLARLKDMHTGVTRTTVEAPTPAFTNLYGGGIWIAADRGRLVLRAFMDGHDLKRKLVPGSELLAIDGIPARIAHERVKRQVSEYSGWSSTHFLDARLSVQFFRFEDDLVKLTLLTPKGKVEEVRLAKWGPEGRGLSRTVETLPEGLEARGGAVSVMLTDEVGYIRILGGMNESTEKDFFAAMEALREAKGILLDCRGMGGGGDGPAWAMAGRFYEKPTDLGINGTLKPSGDWQYTGPVVMLQDEREVSSAETFTWSMHETGRVLSVGRPTGGGTIIPSMFDAPSGLFSFRMGRTDRTTPIKRVQPEGIGTASDVFVPYEPVLLERFDDPIRAVAMDCLLLLIDGVKRDVVAGYYGGLLGADAERLDGVRTAYEKLYTPDEKRGFMNVTKNLTEAMVDWQVELLDAKKYAMPAVAVGKDHLLRLAAVARVMDDESLADKAESATKGLLKEIKAEAAYEKMIDKTFPPEQNDLKSYIKKHGDTKFGKGVASAFK